MTYDQGLEEHPIWIHDNRRVRFISSKRGAWSIYWKEVGQPGEPHFILQAAPDQNIFPTWVAPDGTEMLVNMLVHGSRDVLKVLLGEEPKFVPFLDSRFAESDATVSPNGEWVAYGSDESGRSEVYVGAYPGFGSRSQISKNLW